MNIVISGTVGVGKSTISKELEKHLQQKSEDVFLMDEINEDDPYLDNYYENRPAWSFLIQINFVLGRFNNAYRFSQREGINIFDRHFLDDYIIASMPFVKNDMPFPLWQTYNVINKQLNERLKESARVDIFFLLRADFEEVIRRVENRGRESEKEVDVEYWRDMYNQYYNNPEIQEYIKGSVNKMIIIDANSSNPEEIVKEMIKHIE